MQKLDSRALSFASISICLLFCGFCGAQQSPPEPDKPTQTTPAQATPPQTAPAPLPQAPGPVAGTGTSATPSDEEQTKRILGVLPNFRSISAGANVPKATAKDKFITATEDNFDYTSLFFAGLIASSSFLGKSTPEFHQGAAGYARYYWHTAADQAVENYFVEFIVPEMTHEDPRYFTLGKQGGGFWKRTGYSLSRVVVTRTDKGSSTFNISEIGGSAAAVSASIFYYPTKEQTVEKGLRNWGLDVTYDAVAFLFHEFWPDIRQAIFVKKAAPAATRP